MWPQPSTSSVQGPFRSDGRLQLLTLREGQLTRCHGSIDSAAIEEPAVGELDVVMGAFAQLADSDVSARTGALRFHDDESTRLGVSKDPVEASSSEEPAVRGEGQLLVESGELVGALTGVDPNNPSALRHNELPSP